MDAFFDLQSKSYHHPCHLGSFFSNPSPTTSSQGGSGTGELVDEPWERLAALEREHEKLKASYDQVKSEKEKIQSEIDELTAENYNLKIANGLVQVDSGDKPGVEPELSEEATRKRLERICKRNSQGFLGFSWIVQVGLFWDVWYRKNPKL